MKVNRRKYYELGRVIMLLYRYGEVFISLLGSFRVRIVCLGSFILGKNGKVIVILFCLVISWRLFLEKYNFILKNVVDCEDVNS